MIEFYIYRYLPSEIKDMLDGPRIVSLDNPQFELTHESKDANGPYASLKDLKNGSSIYKDLIISDKKRAEKIVLDRFIVKAILPIVFPQGLNSEYEKIIYRIMQHSNNGTIKGKDVKGVHIYNPDKVRILRTISTHKELGIFKAEIEVLNHRNNKWVKKESVTTFFPLVWDTQRLINECFVAFENKKRLSETEYVGITYSKVNVLFLYSKMGDFKTVYPIYE